LSRHCLGQVTLEEPARDWNPSVHGIWIMN
jgi:hypothetical protein